jgi:hypothetical protein
VNAQRPWKGWLRDVIDPFVSPRVTSRKPRSGEQAMWPEMDALTITVDMGDWWRLGILAGTMTTEYLRGLPSNVRPSVEYLSELERLEGMIERVRVEAPR